MRNAWAGECSTTGTCSTAHCDASFPRGRRVQVTACRFVDSGGSGLRLDLHAQRNRVEDCEFAHLGEAGILLAGYGPGTKDVNHHNDIVNNLHSSLQ